MDLRPHETDPKLTVARYRDEEEAETVAVELSAFTIKSIPVYLGLSDYYVDITKDSSFTKLDSGEIELTHPTTRLARFAGRLTRISARRLSSSPEYVSPYAKEIQTLGDTINHYLSDRTMAIPKYEPPAKTEPTPQELARTAAYEKVKKPLRITLDVSGLAFLGGLPIAAVGRVVEIFSVNPNMQNHVNETVRQIGNDISYTGLGTFVVGLGVGLAAIRARVRHEQLFNDGWNEATSRLDPDGQIEDALAMESPQVQDPV